MPSIGSGQSYYGEKSQQYSTPLPFSRLSKRNLGGLVLNLQETLNTWNNDHHVEHIFTDLGHETQNGYIESINEMLCINA